MIFIENEHIKCRATLSADLEFVKTAEGDAENSRFVSQWTIEQHLSAIGDEDQMHITIEDAKTGKKVGYMLVAGLKNNNNNIELRRIVITDKGHGYGRQAFILMKQYIFDELKAHRLWLDVKTYNERGRHLYKSEGFIEEGIMRESVFYNGQYDSMVIMSILEHEYRDFVHML